MLHWSKNKTRRIRNLAGVRAYRGSKPPRRKTALAEINAPENKLKPYWQPRDINDARKGYSFTPLASQRLKVWVQDFTYISWHGKFYYLAVTLNLATREVYGWAFGENHDANLICDTLEDALRKHSAPDIVHNDRGSEYMSEKHHQLCLANHITMSASDPGEPWQNGFVERFFATFKAELREELKSALSLESLYETIAVWLNYYNTKRIHTVLLMPPSSYAKQLPHQAD